MVSRETDRKEGLTELWLHYLWKENRFPRNRLVTDDNKMIEVVFPGWYNRGWGPDFTDARIRIGDEERFGDVELHLDESAWKDHRHDQDVVYNRVVLHVFYQRSRQKAINHFGQTIPALCLADVESLPLLDLKIGRPDERIKELPGACGLSLNSDRYPILRSMIFQAAEERMLRKADVFYERMHGRSDGDQEQTLYISLCRSIGYSAYDQALVALALVCPYAEVMALFQALHRQTRIEVLGRWLGFVGLLEVIEPFTIHADLRREWMAMRQLWHHLAVKPLDPRLKPQTATRPQNHPLRRLMGLYYHLEHIQFQGLLKSWLKFIQSCEVELQQPSGLQKRLQHLLNALFPQPDWDPLNWVVTADSQKPLTSQTKLIGAQRQRVILTNTILPFFLAWSRIHGDSKLEKTLLSLFLVLPSEGGNRKTRFMELRLLKGHADFKIKKNLSYHQGLIQLYDDCCTSFYEGCSHCSLVGMLRRPAQSGAGVHASLDRNQACDFVAAD